jgi:hypothetical protein
MSSNLKRDQIPPTEAKVWKLNLEEEKKLTFNLIVPPLIFQKETYLKLTGENNNRVRIYLGLEPEQKEGKYVLCAYAVSAFLLGSGDVYRDYENPVFKLDRVNQDHSKSDEVLDNIRRYRKWRMGELDSDNELAVFRKYIYPNAFLMTKYELLDIFEVQGKEEAQIGFGISKTMHTMIYSDIKDERSIDDITSVFNFSDLCPPVCDTSSIFNSDGDTE